MNIILVEDTRFPIGSFLEKIYDRYPRSSILHVNNRNFGDSLTIIKNKPLLTKYWCLILSDKLNTKQYGEIMKGDNLNIIHLSNNNKFLDIKNILTELNYDAKVLNNLKPNKEVVIEYVMDSLKISHDDAKYICNRHRFHIPTIVNSVAILSTFDEVNRKIIRNYTTRFGTASFYNLLDYLLGLDTKTSRKKVIELIYSYRYGFTFVLEFLVKELDKYLLVYDYISRGLLGLDNYLEFEPDMEDKVYKTIGQYQVKKIIETHSILSYDKLYFIYLEVKRIKPIQSNIYKLIKLIGG